MKIKIKKLDEKAVIPCYSNKGDAGLDFTAISVEEKGNKYIYHTGLAVELPEGHVGLLFPRSSVHKTGLVLANSVGVLDSGYRGEIMFIFKKLEAEKEHYEPGHRIGQMIILPYPTIEFEEAHELSETERGEGGYGSTGK